MDRPGSARERVSEPIVRRGVEDLVAGKGLVETGRVPARSAGSALHSRSRVARSASRPRTECRVHAKGAARHRLRCHGSWAFATFREGPAIRRGLARRARGSSVGARSRGARTPPPCAAILGVRGGGRTVRTRLAPGARRRGPPASASRAADETPSSWLAAKVFARTYPPRPTSRTKTRVRQHPTWRDYAERQVNLGPDLCWFSFDRDTEHED